MRKVIAFGIAMATACMLPQAARAADTAATVDRAKQAQSLADQAYDEYQRSDWAKAISLYLESYKISPTAEILYNVASIYDRKVNDRQLAIEYYRRHNASADASPELVAKATARIAELSQSDKNADASTAAPASGAASGKSAAAEEKPSDPGATLRAVGIVTGVVGLIGLGIGTGFGFSAKSKHDDATSAGCSNGVCPDSGSADTERSASKAATVSTVGFIAGGVLLAGGITLYLAAPSKKEGVALRLTPSVGQSSAGITLSGVMF